MGNLKKTKWSSLICLVFCLFVLLNFPRVASQKARAIAIASISPSWESCLFFKTKVLSLLSISFFEGESSKSSFQEMESLKRTNIELSTQVDNLRQWLLSEDRIEEQLVRLKSIDQKESEEEWKPFFKRRRDQLSQMLKCQLKGLPAKVVYREPCSWSSFVWIDIGQKQNRALKEAIVQKNSPVVIGNILVGVVEEVGETQSKVRLISDSRLVPAVRALRGLSQNQVLSEKIEGLLQLLQNRQELFSSEKEATDFFSLMKRLEGKEDCNVDSYLAKGELYGSSLPLWRSRGQLLRGVGFNYDFADEEGPSRDLRTGETLSEKRGKAIPLLKEGDILVTSGLDGIFPSGLEVATVCKVQSLAEGGCSYEIEARACAENLNELSHVFVLAPISTE